MLVRSVVKVGRFSQAVIIPSAVCSLLNIKAGDKMAVTIDNGKLVFAKNNQNERPGASPDALAEAAPESNQEASS